MARKGKSVALSLWNSLPSGVRLRKQVRGVMSITRVMSADKNANLVASFCPALPNLLFGLLFIYNALSFFRHAMGRDELQP